MGIPRSWRWILFSVIVVGGAVFLWAVSPASRQGGPSQPPVYEDIYFADIRQPALGPAPEYGGQGADLDFGYRTIDGRIGEIPPGGELATRHHFYEIFFYLLEGRGRVEVWLNDKTPRQVIECQKDSVFTIPLNAWYRIVNEEPEQPLLYLAVTDRPFRRLLFGAAFVENNPFEFTAEWNEYAALDYKHADLRTWQGRAFHQLKTHPTDAWAERGGRNAYFLSGNRTLNVHISEVPPASSKKAHQHLNEAIIYVLRGEGYTLMYRNEGDPPRKIEWKEGSLVAVPLNYWHQHFNSHPTEPARYLAFKNTAMMYKIIGRDTVHHHEAGYEKAY
ncbi:MAG: cupin domain-containing protein [Nitrospiraceae bacterium]